MFWGIIIALAIAILVYFLCWKLNSLDPLNPVLLMSEVILFLLMVIQSTLMVGAVKARGYVSDVEGYASTLIETGDDIANADDYDTLITKVTERYPIAAPILGKIDISEMREYVAEGHSKAEYLGDNIRSTLNNYIMRRVLWVVGFVGLTVAFVFFMTRSRNYACDIDNIDTIY